MKKSHAIEVILISQWFERDSRKPIQPRSPHVLPLEGREERLLPPAPDASGSSQ